MRKLSPDTAAPLLVGLAAVGVCALQVARYGLPMPAVHDEFSYLLGADTFLHGRLANPPHPLWQHFESIHILQQPTYASKYPPGQALFLAAGWLLWHPILGVWLGMGLACGAATWMLRAFLPRWWAVCGGLLMASRLGFSEWGWNYWGGGVAAAGGALFIGGWTRVLRKPRPLPAVLMTVGLVLMAITRPFEGVLLCLPVGVATLVWLFRRRFPIGVIVRRALMPTLVVLMPAALAFLYYNYRVTGKPLRLPYMEHAAQYDVAPVLLIQNEYPAPQYRHKEIREFHVGEVASELYDYRSGRDEHYWMQRVRYKFRVWWHAYLGYGLALPLLVLPCVILQSPRTRFALTACIVVFGVVATIETWGWTHYTAPVAGLLYLVVLQCLRRISLFRPRRPAARRAVQAWLTGCLLVPALSVSPWTVDLGITEDVLEHPEHLANRVRRALPPRLANVVLDCLSHPHNPPWIQVRSQMEADLRRQGGRHLVLVQYDEGHSAHQEWVYNAAEIDSAPVVWARPMGPEGVKELADYFTDRKIWILDIDKDGLRATRVPIREPIGARPGAPAPRR
jgi:hypothetical protein